MTGLSEERRQDLKDKFYSECGQWCGDVSEEIADFWLDIIEREIAGKVDVSVVRKEIEGVKSGLYADSNNEAYELCRSDILSLPSLGAEGLADNKD